MPVVEVYADIGCPFTHVGLRRLVEQRAERRRPDVRFHVRAWPLELVNGRPLDADFIAQEVDDIRSQVAPDLFSGFRPAVFPSTSLPAMALAAAGYHHDLETGESVSLALRDAVFEEGRDVADPAVLASIARGFGLVRTHGRVEDLIEAHADQVRIEYGEGQLRGVVGSPYFCTADGDFFCPVLDIAKDDTGHLDVTVDETAFSAFLDTCFA